MDVTERKRREDQIKFSNILLSAQQEASPDGILVIDDNRKILLSNKRFADMWGIPSQVIEKKSSELALQSVLDKLEYPQKFLDGVNYLYAHRDETSRDEIVLKDGRTFDRYSAPMVASDGTHYGRVWNFRDVTEQKSLQKQLLQAQKMEAIGTLSGGIAHDFNNLLTVVMGFSELLLAEKEQDDPQYADLQKIFHAAKNGADLVQRLLMFSRKSEPKPVPMNLNKQIVQVEKLLRRTIPKMVDIKLELSADVPEINADASQIEQVLINLAVNARDAMPDVGQLTVRTSIVTLDEEYCRPYVEANPGDYVLLEVSDTGHGMDKETVEHIFEPFFTTKEMGQWYGPWTRDGVWDRQTAQRSHYCLQ